MPCFSVFFHLFSLAFWQSVSVRLSGEVIKKSEMEITGEGISLKVTWRGFRLSTCRCLVKEEINVYAMQCRNVVFLQYDDTKASLCHLWKKAAA